MAASLKGRIGAAADGDVAHLGHLLALDGLRGIAALAIVLYHRRWWAASDWDFLQHAYLAVDFFFVLSGLVIARAYERQLRSGAMRWLDFALLRVARLVPLLLVGAVLGAAYLCLRGVMGHDPGLIGRALAALPFAVALLPIPPALFAHPFALNEPAWTLFFELVANLLFAACAPRLSNKVLLVSIFVFALALAWVAMAYDGLNAGWRWEAFHAGAARVGFSFLLGVGLHRLIAAGRLRGPSVPFWALGLALMLAVYPSILPGRANAGYDLAMAALFFPGLIVLGCNCRSAGAWVPVMRGSGALSYPAYAIHFPLLGWLEAMIWRLGLPNMVMLGFVTVVIAVTAWLLSRYYDAPVRAWLRVRLARIQAARIRGPA